MAVSKLAAVVSLLVSALKKVYVPSVVPVTSCVEALYFFNVPDASVTLIKLSGVPPPLKLVLLIFEGRLPKVMTAVFVPIVFCVRLIVALPAESVSMLPA